MPTDTSVNNLVINKLTKAQYETIQNPIATELYLVPDEVDTAPTSGSSNCVTSGGVYTALSAIDSIVVSTSLPLSGACAFGTYYKVTVSANTTITLPEIEDTTIVKSVVFSITFDSVVNLTIASSNSEDIYYQDGLQDLIGDVAANDILEINCQTSGSDWMIAGIKVLQGN